MASNTIKKRVRFISLSRGLKATTKESQWHRSRSAIRDVASRKRVNNTCSRSSTVWRIPQAIHRERDSDWSSPSALSRPTAAICGCTANSALGLRFSSRCHLRMCRHRPALQMMQQRLTKVALSNDDECNPAFRKRICAVLRPIYSARTRWRCFELLSEQPNTLRALLSKLTPEQETFRHGPAECTIKEDDG